MKVLPDSLIRARPILSVAYALVLLNAGQLEGIESRLQDAERGLAQTVPGSSSTAQATQWVTGNEAQYRSLPASIANTRAFRAQALGDFASTITYAQQALALLSVDEGYGARPIEALEVRWWLRQGRLAEALSWMRTCGLSVDDPPSYLREYEHLTLARVAIAQYQRDHADELIHQVVSFLTRLLAAAEAKERTGSVIKVLVMLALARADDIATSVVSAFQPLVEPLSPREQDVLRWLNTELSGPEIARELVVALSTVRTHTKRIYSKLNVTNRRAAVKRAVELDLI